MLSGSRNGKSVKVYARVPHDLARAIEACIGASESVSDFIVVALRSEVARREKEAPAEKNNGWGF